MKVICQRSALLDALSVAGTVASPRSPKPVLACVKVVAEGDKLTLEATDLEVAVRCSTAHVQVEKDGVALLPADKFLSIVRESADDTLSLSTEGTEAVIKGADSVFKIYTQPPADYPPVPGFEGDADVQVAAGTLRGLAAQTLFAAARDATRFAFNGVLTGVDKDNRLMLVATDGRRLALARGDAIEVKSKDLKHRIIPAKSLNLLDKLLAGGEADAVVNVKLGENQASFSTPSATLVTNLVEGQFPPYQDVIPKDADKKMTAGTADFLSAVKRAALLTSDDSKGVKMEFAKETGLTLSSRNPDSGEATVTFACKYDGAPVTIGFNPQFLSDALKVVDADEVSFELLAPNRPGLLKGGEGFVYVIMPVNLT